MSNDLIPPSEDSPVRRIVFDTYSTQIINANDSAETRADMLEAGLKAALTLKAKGQQDFKVNIEVEGGLNHQKIAQREHRRFMAIALHCAQHKKPVKDLTDEEKFSICVACNVPVRAKGEKNAGGVSALMLMLETAYKCGIVWEDSSGALPCPSSGQYVVYYAKD